MFLFRLLRPRNVAPAQQLSLGQIRDMIRSELLRLAANAQRVEKKRWFAFLNTGLGLWMLSSVVLGGLTFLYSSWSANHAAAAGRNERFARLDAEVELRFQDVVQRINYI